MLVKELYVDALYYDEACLAYSLYYLLKEKKLSLDDDTSIINWDDIDNQAVHELMQKNHLGIKKIRMFTLKMSPHRFAFIFATDEREAINHFKHVFKRRPINCHEYLLETMITRGNTVTTFREIRKEYSHFPQVAWIYERTKGRQGNNPPPS